MSRVIVGVFDRRADAQSAVQDLLRQQVDQNHISLVEGKAQADTAEDDEVGAGSAVGAATGAAVGGAAVLGTFLLPGLGTLVAGSLAAALGAASSSEVPDDDGLHRLERGLMGAGLMEEESRTYAMSVSKGSSLVLVDAPDEQGDAIADLLHAHNPSTLEVRLRE